MESDMPLTNFGSILNFAEELEIQDQEFYQLAAKNPACADLKDAFSGFAADAEKNQKTVQRIRRENVTEMILESISDFTRAPFCEACEGAAAMSAEDALATARRLEKRAERYYREAGEKLKAQPEVARGLKQIGKKRSAHLKQLDSL
jgi:rubrerythrin